jgi:hypothetical protein
MLKHSTICSTDHYRQESSYLGAADWIVGMNSSLELMMTTSRLKDNTTLLKLKSSVYMVIIREARTYFPPFG